MTVVQLSVFSISGLRGIVGEELTPEVTSYISASFGALIGPGTVAVGRDARPSGDMLLSAASAGLASVGRGVEVLGVCPTPTVLHHTRLKGRTGAIVVTASHNPEQWNGMKFADAGGRFLTSAAISRLRAFVESGNFTRADWHQAGQVRTYAGAIEDHIHAITENSLFSAAKQRLVRRPLRVGVDAVNGAAADAAVRLVKELGCEPMPLHCDTTPEALAQGFPRKPEPTRENLTELCRMVKTRNLDLGIALDPDGDRLSCVDDTGFALGEEATICLACKYVLPIHKGPVVVNLSTTRAVEDICAGYRVQVARAPVGEASVVERMAETGAVIGGEGNGGVILPEVNFTRDGLVAAATILGLVAVTGEPLSALRLELPSYSTAKTTVSLTREQYESRKRALLAEFEDCRVDERDGLKFDGPGFWVHVRPSNTEPLVRIISEAGDEAVLNRQVARARAALQK